MAYEIELHYGFERSHDTYETYHAFEATDIEEEADDAAIEAKLADLLDCSPDDEDFDCISMRITLPERTVERIRAEGYAAGRVGILAQMIEGRGTTTPARVMPSWQWNVLALTRR